jgi:hypothetical protein
MIKADHPDVAKAERRGDWRGRCSACGQLICQACRSCNGDHDPESAFTNADRMSGYGRITTDSHGRTLHRECRYMEELLG